MKTRSKTLSRKKSNPHTPSSSSSLKRHDFSNSQASLSSFDHDDESDSSDYEFNERSSLHRQEPKYRKIAAAARREGILDSDSEEEISHLLTSEEEFDEEREVETQASLCSFTSSQSMERRNETLASKNSITSTCSGARLLCESIHDVGSSSELSCYDDDEILGSTDSQAISISSDEKSNNQDVFFALNF